MLAPGKKSYDKPRQHVKKQRYYFANKGPSSQSSGFSSSRVWMWELDCKENWKWIHSVVSDFLRPHGLYIVHGKKAECRRTDVLELWCWRKLLRFPWTAQRSNQSILKEISSEYSLEWLTMKLKLQYFGHLMRRTDSFKRHWCWKRSKAGGGGDDRG